MRPISSTSTTVNATSPMLKQPLPVSYTAAGVVETLPGDMDFSAGLLETMRAQSGNIPLLSLHMARFGRCAGVDSSVLDKIRLSAQEMARLTASWSSGARVRLRYGICSGDLRWDFHAVPLEQNSSWDKGVVLYVCETHLLPSATDSPFQSGKTRSGSGPMEERTGKLARGCKLLRREIYDRAAREVPPQANSREPEATTLLKGGVLEGGVLEGGVLEGLLLDSAGRVIEGLRSNLMLHRGGRWLTPNLDLCGVRGVMLSWLAGRQEISEDILSYEDLTQADELVVCNSVRGVVPVVGLAGKALTGQATGQTTVKTMAAGPATLNLQQLIAKNLW